MKKMKLCLLALGALIAVSSCNTDSIENNTANTSADSVENMAAPDMHTSETSLDWDGTYKGTLPCADCEGIETTIVLKQDKTFERTAVYKGKEDGNFNDKGKFSWDNNGQVITLEIANENPKYKVKEGSIVMVDQSGKENTGELAENYILKKQ